MSQRGQWRGRYADEADGEQLDISPKHRHRDAVGISLMNVDATGSQTFSVAGRKKLSPDRTFSRAFRCADRIPRLAQRLANAGLTSIAHLALAVFGFVSPVLCDTKQARDLSNAIEEMGYFNIHVNSCLISFSRLTNPTKENNGLYQYTRVVHLNTIDLSSPTESEAVSASGVRYYRLEFVHADSYYDIFRQSLLFGSRIKKIFPESHWPYFDVSQQDDWTAPIEAELQKQLTSLNEMNLWINFSSYGRSTTIPLTFQVTDLHRSRLSKLKALLQLYALEQGCSDTQKEKTEI